MPTFPFRRGERRRTTRLSVFADLTVQGLTDRNVEFEVRTRSLSVSGHGGLTVLDVPVLAGQTLVVVNERSKQRAECRVVDVRPGNHGKNFVAFEFLAPEANFWKMTFPPAGTKTLRRSAPSETRS